MNQIRVSLIVFKHCHTQFCVSLKNEDKKFVKMEKLTDDHPLKEYQNRGNESKYHYKKWGQRKLLMAEIQFLSMYFDLAEEITVVYAGAAPGNKTPFLADLFPNITFELWDPGDFAEGNFCHPRIIVNNGCNRHHLRSRRDYKDYEDHDDEKDACCYFTDEIAMEYGKRVENGENILFISDIRTASWRNQGQLDVEDYVLRDHEC